MLRLDRLHFWQHNRIVWAGCDAVPAALALLADELAGALRQQGFQLERRAFAAHVTLLRNARCADALPPLPPLEWPLRDLLLAESRLDAAGSRYAIVGRWPLDGPSARMTTS